MKCENCLFWRSTPDVGTHLGGCHLRPPEIVTLTRYASQSRTEMVPSQYTGSPGQAQYLIDFYPHMQEAVTHWPSTRDDDFCGEFYPNTSPRPKRYRELAAEIDSELD